MRGHFLLTLRLTLMHCLALAGTVLGSTAEAASPMCQRSTLPADIQQALGKYFEPLKIQDPGTLTAEMLARWQAESPTTCPGIISGHLQGRRSIDYVLLLVEPVSQAYRLIAFREQMAGIYSFKVLELGNSGASNRFLRALSPAMRANASLPNSKDGALLVSGSGGSYAAAIFYIDNNGDFLRQPVAYPSG